MQKRKGRIREFERNSRAVDFEEEREKRQNRRDEALEKKTRREQRKVVSIDKRRKKVKVNKIRVLLTFIMIAVIAAVCVSVKGIIDLKTEQSELTAQNKELEQRKAELTEELSHVHSNDYIEEQARLQLRLVMPGEILYIIKDDEDGNKQ